MAFWEEPPTENDFHAFLEYVKPASKERLLLGPAASSPKKQPPKTELPRPLQQLKLSPITFATHALNSQTWDDQDHDDLIRLYRGDTIPDERLQRLVDRFMEPTKHTKPKTQIKEEGGDEEDPDDVLVDSHGNPLQKGWPSKS